MILEKLGKELLYLDGGMGTLLQERGLKPGELPESWNLTRAEDIIDIQRQYYDAGSNIVLTNTFGANAIKFHEEGCDVEQVIRAAVTNAREAARQSSQKEAYVGLDIGPTGKLLAPMGDLQFEEAYEAFAEVVRYGVSCGVDLIQIETMSDTYELKAAVLAAKEHSNLPVFATLIFDERGKLLTGADVSSVVAMLEGLRVDALGINCGLGPAEMMPVIEQILKAASVPVIVKPNAGLPKQKDGETYYDVLPADFAAEMQKIVGKGALVIGGCCGTTPEHIAKMVASCKDVPVRTPEFQTRTIVSSYGKSVTLGRGSKIIGERINPTGKKKFKQALKDHDLEYILKEGIMQQDHGAHILDVNVGLPDIDEVSMMKEVVTSLQSVTNLPLQIDTVNAEAMEAAMRIYNGKPMINSVNGKQESMDEVFPLVQKYGGVVVALTLDEDGIPETAEGRLNVAKKIIEEAAKYGIYKKDIVVDVLTMTISSEPTGALTTLKALELVRQECGVHTVLGVSNISFGLPARPIINSNFYMLAMQHGLSAGIINPNSEDMMKAYYSYHALMALDENCSSFIKKYGATSGAATNKIENKSTELSLKECIEKGLKEEAVSATRTMMGQMDPLEIINASLIPALDFVGKGFETGTVFLPQLLMSAEAAKGAFAVIKDAFPENAVAAEQKPRVILATVKGDIHDIGKNIVKVLLENYSFDVIDLGKDVDPSLILDTVKERQVRLVGLSALMTTTVVNMKATIELLRKEVPDCKVMVGGAVLNQEYADMIGADFYGKDAMQSVYYAQKFFGTENK